MIVQHSAETPEHYTPSRFIQAAYKVMGAIDLDPATTESVNRQLVGAKQIYTKETDGLSKEWSGRVWLNPPGGLIERESSAAVWWRKLANEWTSGRVKQALFMGFTLEILRSTQDNHYWIGHMPFCVPSSRIDFLQEKSDGSFMRGGSPAHANLIAYLPPIDDYQHMSGIFKQVFGQFGMVRL